MASTTPTTVSPTSRGLIKAVDRAALFVVKHWLGLFLLVYGLWVWAPILAPIFMQNGWTTAGNGVYFMYSLFCHQLPERSLFFFGPQTMYSLEQIGQFWPTTSPVILRQFVGNAELGWKMAWSDRMISTYGGIWIGAVLWAIFGKRVGRLSLVVWLLVGVLPLALDGFSHFLNDIVAGTSGQGFRDTNEWLIVLTGGIFPAEFYYGNMLGSFNSWTRWITGLLFAITTVFAMFPIIGGAMHETQRDLEHQLSRIEKVEGAH